MSMQNLLKCTMFAGLYGAVVSLSFIILILLHAHTIILVVSLICLAVTIICLLIYNIYYLIRNYDGIIVLLISIVYELAIAFISCMIFSFLLWEIFGISLSPDPD